MTQAHDPSLAFHFIRHRPWLSVEPDRTRLDDLWLIAGEFEGAFGANDPRVALARSWYAVAHGSEAFDESLLELLQETEVIIREHFPNAHTPLALNLAAQGCHTWFLRDKLEAIQPLTEAFELMLAHSIALEADVVKVAEVLADCLSECDIDGAASVLHRALPYVQGALEQDEFIAAQFHEFREEFLDEYGDYVSSDVAHLIEPLRGAHRGAGSLPEATPDIGTC